MFRPPVDRCMCPKYQSELGPNLCSHLAFTHCVAPGVFIPSPLAALLLTCHCVLSASSEEKQEKVLVSSCPPAAKVVYCDTLARVEAACDPAGPLLLAWGFRPLLRLASPATVIALSFESHCIYWLSH